MTFSVMLLVAPPLLLAVMPLVFLKLFSFAVRYRCCVGEELTDLTATPVDDSPG